MLKFDTEDFDEHYRCCILFNRNDQKKVCFYKSPQMDFEKNVFLYHKP